MTSTLETRASGLSFRQLGYRVLSDALTSEDLELLERECQVLHQWANRIVEGTVTNGITLAEYYRASALDPIVVLESGQHSQVCRFERLVGTSAPIEKLVSQRLKPRVEELVGEQLVLFKDKCNLKLPGGGAFPAHQDARAYRHFGPNYHATAMVMLDDADAQNGCLEVAHRYREAHVPSEVIGTTLGAFPLFADNASGPDNGSIRQEISGAFEWRRLELPRGQVVVFDSFLPHRSAVNASNRNRRALFFTFNLAADGSFYEQYYRAKAEGYSNPIFHVATPTLVAGDASAGSRRSDAQGAVTQS